MSCEYTYPQRLLFLNGFAQESVLRFFAGQLHHCINLLHGRAKDAVSNDIWAAATVIYQVLTSV